MPTSLHVIAASLAVTASLAAQVNLNLVGSVDLSSTADKANPEFIGNNPSAIAWDGTDLYAAGFNQSGGAADTGITLVADALNAGFAGAAFGVLKTDNLRGYSGLDIGPDGLAAAWDNGGVAPEGLQLFDESGNLVWQRRARGGSGVGFDPGFCGVDAGTAWTTFGSGRRALQDDATGDDTYTTANGMIILAPTSGTFWRDMDFAPNGDIYLRRGNDVVAHTRTGGNSLTGSRFVQDNGANGNFIALQNVAYIDQGDGVVIWNDRSSTAGGQAFTNVVKCNAADGTPLTLNFGSYVAPDGNGAYDFSYDAASRTLAIMDFAARTVDIFDVSVDSPTSVFTTTFASNNGAAGNMFDIVAQNPAGITVDYFDVNLDSGTWDMEIYAKTTTGTWVGSQYAPADWTLIASTAGIQSNGAGVPTTCPIATSTYIAPGDTQAFYVTVTNGDAINYTTGNQIPIGTIYTSNADLDFLAGVGNAYPFGNFFGGATSSRIFNGNIHYRPGNDPFAVAFTYSTATRYGKSCYERYASYYEQSDAASFDLGGTSVIGTRSGDGYTISTGPSSLRAVGASGFPFVLPLGDDDVTIAGNLGLYVGSNCWVAFGAGNSPSWVPSVETMLSNPSTAVYAWTDLRPASAGGFGDIYYEQSGSVATVTYDGVQGRQTSTANTVQFVIDTATGDYSIHFDTVSSVNPEDWLVGFSPGGASLDPGPVDISAGTFTTQLIDTSAMSLESSEPMLGSDWDLSVTNAGASPIAFIFFGDTMINPGLDLAGIGAPGCSLYTNANLGAFTFPTAGGAGGLCLRVPSNPTVLGAGLSAQATTASTANALNVVTSNGYSVVVGNL